MEIQKIAIIGLGLIGGSIAKALKNSQWEYYISAYDFNDVTSAALREKVIDRELNTIEESVNSDIIFLCLPVDLSLDVFEKLVPVLRENNILTDVCSVKNIFFEKWNMLNSGNGIYIGSHPMTGKENGGYENSDPLLFENSVYIVTENLTGNDKLIEFRKVIEALGANILHIPAKQHDVIAASVSHLPQLLSVALVNTASLKTENYNFLDLAAGGFRDMTRIASSNFKIWEPIIENNKNQILTALDKFSYELSKVKLWVLGNDLSGLSEYFETARQNRDEIPQNTKGFITPIYDIYIYVKDEPGVISKISTKLYEAKINIKDIELLKIRDGAGGTFRLSFESKEIAEKAKTIIGNLGFKSGN